MEENNNRIPDDGWNSYEYGSGVYSAYRQPPQKSDSFAVASLVMGILALFLALSGIAGLMFGALGIIFAVLSRTRYMQTAAKVGVGLSVAGMVLGGMMLAAVFFTMSSGDFQKQLNEELRRYGYEYRYGGEESLPYDMETPSDPDDIFQGL